MPGIFFYEAPVGRSILNSSPRPRASKRALSTCTCAPHLEDSTASLGARFGGELRELGPAEWGTFDLTTRDAPMLAGSARFSADSARRAADSARRAAGFALGLATPRKLTI